MGFRTHVFAWEAGAVAKDMAFRFYPISIVEKEQILDIAKKIQPGGVVSIASDLAQITVNYVATGLGLVSNGSESTQLSTNKYMMRRALKSSGLPCPNFEKASAYQPEKIEKFEFPIVIKPVDRSGSRGVTKVSDKLKLKEAFDTAFEESFSKEVIIEEFIEGREISVEMISWKSEHFYITTTDKVTTGSPHFIETEQHQPSSLPEKINSRVIELAKRALSALKIQYGASHTEFLITDKEEIFIVEVGARMGGDHIGARLVELSCGFDYLREVINISCGIEPKIIKTYSKCSGIKYLLPLAGKVSKIVNNCTRYPELVEWEVFVNRGDTIASISDSSDRAGYILYQADHFFHTEVSECLKIDIINDSF